MSVIKPPGSSEPLPLELGQSGKTQPYKVIALSSFGQKLIDLEIRFPIDEPGWREFGKRENRRAQILLENIERAQPFLNKTPKSPEDAIINKQTQNAFEAGVEWLEAHFRNDYAVKAILVAARREDINFKSNRDLSAACGLSKQLIKEAKSRLKYALKNMDAASLDAFLNLTEQPKS